MAGPLNGLRVIEFAGIGPAPFCGMMLADHGAEIVRIDRIGAIALPNDPLGRSKKSIAINTKTDEGVAIARALCATADGAIEGFRPGVMERLGLGPEILCKDNPSLVYGRMTGWGQTGPLAEAAGHDINYISLSGALHTCGRRGERPTPPVNYLGDFGGGGMMLAFAMVSAILAVKNGAAGQVVDCAMTEGSAVLTAMTWGLKNAGMWSNERGVNMLDTGAHYYDVYETKDGKWISIGSIEPQFYDLLREKAALSDSRFDVQNDSALWPALKSELELIFKTRTCKEWCAIMEGSDVCFAPVLDFEGALSHPHNIARESFVQVGGDMQPAPAPRYSVTATDRPNAAPIIGGDAETILDMIGRRGDAAALRHAGVIG